MDLPWNSLEVGARNMDLYCLILTWSHHSWEQRPGETRRNRTGQILDMEPRDSTEIFLLPACTAPQEKGSPTSQPTHPPPPPPRKQCGEPRGEGDSARPCFHGPSRCSARFGLPWPCHRFLLPVWGCAVCPASAPLWICGAHNIYFHRFIAAEDETHLKSHTYLIWVIFKGESCVF